jgi:hypothetical protein
MTGENLDEVGQNSKWKGLGGGGIEFVTAHLAAEFFLTKLTHTTSSHNLGTERITSA